MMSGIFNMYEQTFLLAWILIYQPFCENRELIISYKYILPCSKETKTLIPRYYCWKLSLFRTISESLSNIR